MKACDGENRCKQVLVAALVLSFLALAAMVVIIGSHFLPGFFGGWIEFMVGLATSPVLLEITAFSVGLIVVLWINQWRKDREGPECVYLEPEEPSGKDKQGGK